MKTTLGLTMVAAALMASTAGGNAFAGDDRTRMRCDSDGAGDTSMDARYEERRGRTKFDGSFEAAPGGAFAEGDMLPVVVGGIDVGYITLLTQINGDLGGDIEFDTQADEFNPFPSDFPEVFDGTSVIVGPLGCDLEG